MTLPWFSKRSALVVLLFSLVAVVGACGGDADTGLRSVSIESAADIFENQPADLFVLDVRTPEEFEAGHLDGAVMIDYYEPDFANRINELDRDVPYLLYCRSGNRSGSTLALMEDLGFTNVTNVEGGINAWRSAGQPVVG